MIQVLEERDTRSCFQSIEVIRPFLQPDLTLILVAVEVIGTSIPLREWPKTVSATSLGHPRRAKPVRTVVVWRPVGDIKHFSFFTQLASEKAQRRLLNGFMS